MTDLAANLAQELADHLDDLRETGEGVTDYDDQGREYPVTEVSDATPSFDGTFVVMALIGGKPVRITVATL